MENGNFWNILNENIFSVKWPYRKEKVKMTEMRVGEGGGTWLMIERDKSKVKVGGGI